MDRGGGGAMDVASCVLAGHVDAMRQTCRRRGVQDDRGGGVPMDAAASVEKKRSDGIV